MFVCLFVCLFVHYWQNICCVVVVVGTAYFYTGLICYHLL